MSKKVSTIIVATGNKNKIREIREILQDSSVELISMKDAGIVSDPEENGEDFVDNALIKARACAAAVAADRSICPGGCLVISDDSGLSVDAMNGEPGIRSARFMGHDTSYDIKNAAILDNLKDTPEEKRTARFICAAAAVSPDGEEWTAEGVMEGHIAHAPAGAGGFGYDPIFYLPEYGKTSAEISEEEKNAISHRGKALRALFAKLKESGAI